MEESQPIPNPRYRYQVGGSLSQDAPSYIARAADQELYDALQAGEYCHVLNARQMGKSSLLVRMSHRLQAEGGYCVTLDLTRMGSETVTTQQWYRGIVTELWDGFDLHQAVNLQQWWQTLETLSIPQRLSRFIDEVLLKHIPQGKIFIFVDELDSILSLPFPVDDFFALVRFCFNQRVRNPAYERLAFGLFGVATSSDLIRDRQRTPFNIGRAIQLQGFTPQEAAPLAKGLVNLEAEQTTYESQALLKAILAWTAGQPFLTQKLCQWAKVVLQASEHSPLEAGMEQAWVEQLVRSQLIQYWETQDHPEHLRTIRDRIQRNGQRAGRMLAIYQQTLLAAQPSDQSPAAPAPALIDNSREQVELLLSGLVIKHQNSLRVKNRIYGEVFNLAWVQQQLDGLRPYSEALSAWRQSEQNDDSRLLRGQALQDAQAWARGKSLSDLDYQFLASSEALDRRLVQQSLELERAQAVRDRLKQERKNTKLQQGLLAGMGIALLGLLGFSAVVLRQNRIVRLSRAETEIQASQALLASHQDLEALVTALQAENNLSGLTQNASMLEAANRAIRRALFHIHESNSFSGHAAAIRTIAFSPDGQLLATASEDQTVKLWQPNGQLITSLEGHGAAVSVVAFSPDGQLLATASEDKTAKLWRRDGSLLTTLKGHTGSVWAVGFTPASDPLGLGGANRVITSSSDSSVKIWALDGKLLKTLEGHQTSIFQLAIDPQGELMATGSADNIVKLWQQDGTWLKDLEIPPSRTSQLRFSPDGELLAGSHTDGTVQFWQRDGQLLRTIKAHDTAVYSVRFSPDSQQFATASGDQTLKLWERDGTLIKTLRGHQALVSSLSFSPDSKTLASAARDNRIKIWQLDHPLLSSIGSHDGAVLDVAFSPNGQQLVTTGDDQRVRLWGRDGAAIATLTGHQSEVWETAFSPDGQVFATASDDATVRLWSRSGKLRQVLRGHKDGVRGVAFSPDSQTVATTSLTGVVKLWQRDGQLLHSFQAHEAPVWDVAFSPDGQTLATVSGDSSAKHWDRQGRLLATFDYAQAALFDVTFSPDGQTLATASADGQWQRWQLDGQLIASQGGHGAAVFTLKYSPDGTMVATAGSDNIAKLWQADGKLIMDLEHHDAGVNSLAFSSDGGAIATVSEDKTILLWDLEAILSLDLRSAGCRWVKDYLQILPKDKARKESLCTGL